MPYGMGNLVLCSPHKHEANDTLSLKLTYFFKNDIVHLDSVVISLMQCEINAHRFSS